MNLSIMTAQDCPTLKCRHRCQYLSRFRNSFGQRISNEKQKELTKINQSPKEFLKPIPPENVLPIIEQPLDAQDALIELTNEPIQPLPTQEISQPIIIQQKMQQPYFTFEHGKEQNFLKPITKEQMEELRALSSQTRKPSRVLPANRFNRKKRFIFKR